MTEPAKKKVAYEDLYNIVWPPSPRMTRSGQNHSWRWRSIWVISGYSSRGCSYTIRVGGERLIHLPSWPGGSGTRKASCSHPCRG